MGGLRGPDSEALNAEITAQAHPPPHTFHHSSCDVNGHIFPNHFLTLFSVGLYPSHF